MKILKSVGSGAVFFMKKGKNAIIKAPNLTICTAVFLRAYDRERNLIGYMLAHRGAQSSSLFQKAIIKSIEDVGENPNSLFFKIEAVQTASDTSVIDSKEDDTFGGSHHDFSDDAMSFDINKVLNVINIDEFTKIKTVGVKESFGVKQMVVEIKEDDSVVIQQPRGIFTDCNIM